MSPVDPILLKQRKAIAILKGFDYETVQDAAARLKRHPSLVSHMASDNRIPGAFKFGTQWMVPKTFILPKKKKGRPKKKKKIVKDEILALQDPSKTPIMKDNNDR